jgi:hypothetical protein
MSGMGSTLQPNNPTVVASFRSALIHQGIIALLIVPGHQRDHSLRLVRVSWVL